MEQTWRWYGPDDPITLRDIGQTRATGIVTSLYHIPYGDVWPLADIERLKQTIEQDCSLGLRWSVVESLPVAEGIKRGGDGVEHLYDNYCASLRKLARCGITTVCYNFMPLWDWTRTGRAHETSDGAKALSFSAPKLAAFDCFILQRVDAEADYSAEVLAEARDWMAEASDSDRCDLVRNILAGLSDEIAVDNLDELRDLLGRFGPLSNEQLRDNLARFLRAVVPAAEDCGVDLGIHPDDPPRPMMGLPRVVSTADDVAFLLDCVASPSNGLTFDTGSFGERPCNDVEAMAARFAKHIKFAHLRNQHVEPDGSFVEVDHLDGAVDMVAVLSTLLAEEARRQEHGQKDWPIPFRADHGNEILSDVGATTHAGYPLIGRLRGLAELRGAVTAIARLRDLSGADTEKGSQ